jgi:hypothetical protein
VDDAYRSAEPQPTRAPLTIRWSNLAGRGWLKGSLLCIAFLGMATLFVWVALMGARHSGVAGLVWLLVLLAMAGFFIVAALGTGGITLTQRSAIRYRGLLFIPLLRARYRIDPVWMVRVEEQRVRRRHGWYIAYTAVIDTAGTTIPLRHYFDREHAESQAQRVREYLAG